MSPGNIEGPPRRGALGDRPDQGTTFDDTTGQRRGGADSESFGSTYDPQLDGPRLGRQAAAVLALMLDGVPRSLPEIAARVEGMQTSLSARLRSLRRAGYTVESRRVRGGTWHYRIAPRGPT